MSFYFNDCPKCINGTIRKLKDQYGEYLSCVTCGYNKELGNVLTQTEIELEVKRRIRGKPKQ